MRDVYTRKLAVGTWNFKTQQYRGTRNLVDVVGRCCATAFEAAKQEKRL